MDDPVVAAQQSVARLTLKRALAKAEFLYARAVYVAQHEAGVMSPKRLDRLWKEYNKLSDYYVDAGVSLECAQERLAQAKNASTPAVVAAVPGGAEIPPA